MPLPDLKMWTEGSILKPDHIMRGPEMVLKKKILFGKGLRVFSVTDASGRDWNESNALIMRLKFVGSSSSIARSHLSCPPAPVEWKAMQ